MAALAEKQQETVGQIDPLKEAVSQQNGLTEMRSKVHALLDRFEDGKLATRQTVSQYRQGADQDESVEGLKGYYQWITEQWFKASTKLNQLERQIDEGIREKIMSDSDREFLMEKLILTDQDDFIGNLDKVEGLLKDKIERMQADRKQYDELIGHPLLQNTGFIKLDANTKIEFPNEKAFLDLSVPERREILKKVKEALPKAEKYAETQDDAESEKMTKEYAKLLEAARKEGIIGRKSIDKYVDGFKKIDRTEKEAWLKEMQNGNQLQRYRQLWTDIKKTLPASSVSQMEGVRDQMGYSELLNKYGQLKGVEAERMDREYGQRLETSFQNRLISLHTKRAFMADMQAQPLDQKQHYLTEFDNQMQRYRQLRNRIDNLKSKDARAVLNEMYASEEFGYSEIEAKYNRLAGNIATNQANAPLSKRAEKHLAVIRNDSIKGAARYANEILGDSEKKNLVEKLTAFFQGRDSQKQDAKNFQDNMREARKEHQQYYEEQTSEPPVAANEDTETELVPEIDSSELRLHAANDDFGQAEEQNQTQEIAKPKVVKKAAAPTAKTRIDATKAYQRTSYNTKNGERNVVRLGIGEKGALDAFMHDKSLNKERDSLDLMAKDGAKKYKLTQQDSTAVINYLRAEINNPDEEE